MKVYTSVTIVILLFSVLVVPISIIGTEAVQSNWERSVLSNASSESIADKDVPDICITIGKIELSIHMKVPNHNTIIIFESDNTKSIVEYIVEPSNDKFHTSIILDGVLIFQNDLDKNILAPVLRNELDETTPIETSTLATEKIQQPLTADYTYKWWDGVRQVTGPSYLIKYTHPDRDYYQIATWNDWSRAGSQTTHNQMNSYTSGILIPGGMAAIFAAIGAFLTAEMGPAGVAAGAFIGAVLGTAVGFAIPAILGDEAGCIWWWWGIYYSDWLMANLWWLVITGPFGLGAAIGALLKVGYLKIGTGILLDPMGIGGP